MVSGIHYTDLRTTSCIVHCGGLYNAGGRGRVTLKADSKDATSSQNKNPDVSKSNSRRNTT